MKELFEIYFIAYIVGIGLTMGGLTALWIIGFLASVLGLGPVG